MVDLLKSIIAEKPAKNDKGFAGNLGLSVYQEQHYMTSDIDQNRVKIG